MGRHGRLADPDWPTTMRARFPDGRCLGVDSSVWLYKAVPMGPVTDAVCGSEMLAVAAPLHAALLALGEMARSRVNRRNASRGTYREFHVLLVNIPRRFVPDPDRALADFLAERFPDRVVDRRLLLLGVRLAPRLGTGGFRAAVDSVTETLLVGGAPISDFDLDLSIVDGALSRCGLTTPTGEQFALANAWWNSGHFGDTPQLVHSDHLHIFASPHSLREAARLEAERADCRAWPHLSRHHTIALGTVQEFDSRLVPADDAAAHWACELIERDALAVSVRGRVEPAKITRAELRRNRRRYREDIRESQQQAGGMDRAEVTEKLAELEAVEAVYSDARSAEPTVVDTSIVAAFSGRNERGSFDLDGETTRTVIASMVHRQDKALTEMMLCSPLRANPYRHDESASMIAYSGLPSLSVVGDADGALLGFTERDRQPARISPVAAAVNDGLPMMLVAGQTGSGKQVDLSTTVPTPLGCRRVGDLRVGDEVFGRNGRPTRVTYLSPVEQNPDCYRLTLSDGQQIDADHDHQWVVSDFRDRNACRHPKHRAALARWEDAQRLVAQVEALARRYANDHALATHSQLADLLAVELGADNPWRDAMQVRAALVMAGCPREFAHRPVVSRRRRERLTKVDPVVLFPVAATLRACIARWESVTGGNAVRWAAVTSSRLTAARAALAQVHESRGETIPEVLRMLRAEGAEIPTTYTTLAKVAREEGLTSRPGHREVTIPLADHTRKREVAVYPTNLALRSLAARLAEQYHNAPANGYMERRMTTGEMIEAGVRRVGGHANFAIRVTDPVQMPEAELPVPPYVLGVWLGDGSTGSPTGSGGLTGLDPEIWEAIEADGYHVAHCSNPMRHHIHGLSSGLRRAGVLHCKHIPMVYLRASVGQRLALLQGLMDTDGTVDANGACELALRNRRLAADALELIRSLGIKCRMTESEAGCTSTDPETGEKSRRDSGASSRRVTGTRYRMRFTTDLPAFRLSRKASRQSLTVPETQRWLYITRIEKIDAVPMRCIQVEDPDHTYLVEGFVPTSNTQVLLWMATQFARMGSPNVILDPKQGSDHSEVVLASGGQVSSLDDLVRADGVFDPLRFSASREVAVETAAAQLLRVNPWGTCRDDYEQPLTHALAYGVAQGATCTGQALVLADDAHKVPPGLVKRVMDQTDSSPMFRAFVGVRPGTKALRVQDGITLIKVGDAHLDLPEPGGQGDTLPQRIALALVRMMVFGSSMALTGRRGVLHLDEAWVMLSAGRSEVEKMGRLARSQEVLPILYTQRVSDAVRAELAGYISRGLILPIADPDEARAACDLFRLEPTAERLSRITAPATVAGAAEQAGAPNWASMRALRDPVTRRVLRGSIGIYKDLASRAVPVEITLPESFLAMSSTNTADLRERADRLRRAAAEQREQQQWEGVDTLAGTAGSLMDADVEEPAEPVQPAGPARAAGTADPLGDWL